ncbi:hypothetical protein [Achromobacter aloeverae]
MRREKTFPSSPIERTAPSYLASVTVGTLTITIWIGLVAVPRVKTGMHNSLRIDSLGFIVLFVAAWMSAIVVTALPCAGLSFLARKFRIRAWLLYFVAGIAISALAALACVHFLTALPWLTGTPSRYVNADIAAALFKMWQGFLPAGAVAGLMFWRLAGRHY